MGIGRLLGSMAGGMGGRALGSAIAGPTGGMVGGMIGSILAGRGRGMGGRGGGGGSLGGGLGGLLGGLTGGGGGGNDGEFDPSALDDDTATVLVRAMVNAAKADGQVDEAEIESIVGQLGDLDKEEETFLRTELGRPMMSAADFAASVPANLAQQAYGLSVAAIDLDEQSEAKYLADLAGGLGIDGPTANTIHEQVGAPKIFN